jgi:MFS family permease
MEYKWTVLANTTMGGLMASINATIILISLPAIFRGLNVNPSAPSNFVLLLWVLMGYMLVTASFLVTFGRLSDYHGRKKFYTLGFSIFAVSSVLLSLVPYNSGVSGAIYIIILRLIQAVGGGFIMVNSVALLTDAFPDKERGKALGLNQVAFMAGSFIGIVLGGVLASIDFHWIFIINIPFAVAGALWSYFFIKEEKFKGVRKGTDYLGNAALSIGMVLVSLGLTYSLEPYGSSQLGWGNPWVLASLAFGVASLISFVLIELRAKVPLFNLHLFKRRAFSFGTLALLFNTLARGAVMFLVIIWLQGVYLPLHGFPISSTPFWAGIYMIPLMVGFIAFGPISGYLTDKYGARIFSTTGLGVNIVGLLALTLLPANFSLIPFFIVLFIIGAGGGLFSAPNTKRIMDALPRADRGAGNGIRTTFANMGQLVSMGLFFTIAITIFSIMLPSVILQKTTALGLPLSIGQSLSSIPASGMLFSAFLGINPVKAFVSSLPASTISSIPASTLSTITADKFIPTLISSAFIEGLRTSIYISIGFLVVAVVLSALIKRRFEGTVKD